MYDRLFICSPPPLPYTHSHRASDHAATLRRLALLTPSLHAGLPLPSPSAPPPALYRWDETFLALSELPVVQAPGRGASGWATLALFLVRWDIHDFSMLGE